MCYVPKQKGVKIEGGMNLKYGNYRGGLNVITCALKNRSRGWVAERGTLIQTWSLCPVLKMKRVDPEPRNVVAFRSWEGS